MNSPVISVTISMTAIGALAMPPKSAPIPTTTNGSASAGMPGTWPWSIPHIAPPSMPPMKRPGAKTPPLPPEPIVSDVAMIFSATSAAIVPTASCAVLSSIANCSQP